MSSITYPTIPDLSQLQFGNEKDALEIGYFAAMERIESTIINSTTKYDRIYSPDAIRFSGHAEIIKKIEALSSDILLRPTTKTSKKLKLYEIPASEAQLFFSAVKDVQEKNQKLFFPTSIFKNTLTVLTAHSYLTQSESASLEVTIRTRTTLKELKQATEKEKNITSAIALAQYYAAQSNYYSALDWLCKANNYTKNSSLHDFVDIGKFLLPFTQIDQLDLFTIDNNVVLEAVAKCPSIRKVHMDASTNYHIEQTSQIGKLLTLSQSIQSVDLSSGWLAEKIARLNAETITPIARALETNTSIESLNFAETCIGDDGITQIIKAITKNPQSKISFINFFSCGMTDAVADKLIAFLQKSPYAITVTVAFNNALSKEKEHEIEKVIEERLNQ